MTDASDHEEVARRLEQARRHARAPNDARTRENLNQLICELEKKLKIVDVAAVSTSAPLKSDGESH